MAFCLLDGAVTLVGQSDSYWEGCYSDVAESCPTLNRLLATHPAAFVGGLLIWIAAFVIFILLVPDILALIASLGITMAHAAGAATWFLWHFRNGYQKCNGLFFVAAIVLGIGIRYSWGAGPQRSPEPRILSPKIRTVMAMLLFAATALLFFWPRNPCFDTFVRLAASLTHSSTTLQ